MATVDLNHVQFWVPPNPFLYKQRTTSSQSKKSSRNQLVPLHNKADRIFKRDDQSKSTITGARHQGDDFASRAQRIAGRNTDSTNCDDEADDDLPSLEEILGLISRRGISTGGDLDAEAALQDLDKPSGSCIGPKQSSLDNGAGDSQGTQDRPVIFKDDELDIPDHEAATVFTSVDAGADSAFELSKPIDPSDHEARYDVEAGCYVEEELPLDLEPEQEGLAASTPFHDHGHSRYHSTRPLRRWIGQCDNDGNTQCTSEEPAPHSLPKLLDKDGGGGSEENVSELERDMLLAFEEQEESSSATAPSSPQPPRRCTKQLQPRIDEQSRTSYSSLEGLRHGSPLHVCPQEYSPYRFNEQLQDQICQDDDDSDSDHISHNQSEAEKAEEKGNSSDAADGDNEDDDDNDQVGDSDKGLRLAKRRQLSSYHDGPPLKRNRKVHFQLPHNSLLRSPPNPDRSRTASVPARLKRPASSRCDNQPESRKSSSPSPMGDEEPTSNAGVAYQEWPMRGFFKLITIGNEVHYGMEFSLEDVQQLCAAAFPLHTSSASSNTSLSARPSRHDQPFSACARAENASSRSKRPRFTKEEDARLVDLKERRGWSWDDIQRSFPGRSTGSLQVHYSTKLKDRNTVS